MKNANPTKALQSNKRTAQRNYPELKRMLTVHLTYEEDETYSEYLEFQRDMGGFNPETKALSPLRFSDEFALDHYLSSLTGALESGAVSMTIWPQQLFADEVALTEFLEALEFWDDRLNDRQYRMVRLLTTSDWPCVTNADAAEALRDAANWLKNFPEKA